MNRSKYIYLFYQFLTAFNKNYDETTFFKRFGVFVENYKYIEEMNQQELSFELGMTPFVDMTRDEFKMMYLGGNMTYTKTCEEWKSDGTVADHIDWRDKNIISDVKDQGQCGSCWAFAATEVLESSYALKTGELPILAPQELVDCEKTSLGCSGGYPDHALEYIIDHGLELEKDYPYTARNGQCKSSDTKYKMTSCFNVPPNDEKTLQEVVSSVPVIVLIEADQRVFQFYKSGIIDAKSCGQNIDHAVQLVGYGTENGRDYWLIRNSWGAQWGENGYVRLERNAGVKGGTCGVLSGPSGFYVK